MQYHVTCCHTGHKGAWDFLPVIRNFFHPILIQLVLFSGLIFDKIAKDLGVCVMLSLPDAFLLFQYFTRRRHDFRCTDDASVFKPIEIYEFRIFWDRVNSMSGFWRCLKTAVLWQLQFKNYHSFRTQAITLCLPGKNLDQIRSRRNK